MRIISERIIRIITEQSNEKISVTVEQRERVFETNLKFEFNIQGEFDNDLVLRSIKVHKMNGSKGMLCHNAKKSLQKLVGNQAGINKGFMRKVKELRGENFCMHFPSLLEQMAMAAFRTKRYLFLKEKGLIEFLRSNLKIFKGKCAGYSLEKDNIVDSSKAIEMLLVAKKHNRSNKVLNIEPRRKFA